MLFISKEIGMLSIDDKCSHLVLFDIVRIGELQVQEVFVRNRLLVRTVSFFDVLLKLIYRHVKVDEDVGLRHLLVNDVEQFLIEAVFFFRQVYFSKEQAFGKKIISYGN